MRIAILTYKKPHESIIRLGAERIKAEIEALGHEPVHLFEPYVSFIDDQIFYKGEPLSPIDVIINRPNFVEEPSVRTYVVQKLIQHGYRVINGTPGFGWAKNKLTQHLMFEEHHLPCPRWAIAREPEYAEHVAELIGYPCVMKVAFGTLGKGVFIAPNKTVFSSIVDYLAIRDGNPVIIEEFIEEAAHEDIRAFVINGVIVGAMKRTAPEDDFRANTSSGGTASPIELSKEEQAIALKAASVFNLELAGVDLIRSKHGPLILEINGNPGFKALEAANNLNIAKLIVEYAISQVK